MTRSGLKLTIFLAVLWCGLSTETFAQAYLSVFSGPAWIQRTGLHENEIAFTGSTIGMTLGNTIGARTALAFMLHRSIASSGESELFYSIRAGRGRLVSTVFGPQVSLYVRSLEPDLSRFNLKLELGLTIRHIANDRAMYQEYGVTHYVAQRTSLATAVGVVFTVPLARYRQTWTVDFGGGIAYPLAHLGGQRTVEYFDLLLKGGVTYRWKD